MILLLFAVGACTLFIDAINSRVDKLFNALQNLRYHVHKPVCRALSVGRHNTNISLFLGDKCQRRDAHTDGACSCKRETGITVCFISCLFSAAHMTVFSSADKKGKTELGNGQYHCVACGYNRIAYDGVNVHHSLDLLH